MFSFCGLFGCKNNKKPEQTEYPFDKEKAYFHHRGGVIAGGNCTITMEPEGIVTYYSYIDYPPEYECGMRDKGADIYFVGEKSGNVKVTIEHFYPTTESESYSFYLTVDDNLNVSKSE